MAKLGGGGYAFMGSMPDNYNVAVNANHTIVQKILKAETDDQKAKLAKQAYDLALQSALRLVQVDPLREEGHRALMRLYHLLGRTDDALRAFAHCRGLLDSELEPQPARARPTIAALAVNAIAGERRRAI